ncbi:hypothetical protein HGRIS_008767 [Hohenbuehelia grisea]|uniref:F-box domain-containing protein n=1 Tax=Hohenbuehelia grisea TaxID=104357 RepID=A0ABR3JAI3_9AGAR
MRSESGFDRGSSVYNPKSLQTHPPTPAMLASFPREIVDYIVLLVVNDAPLAPPADLNNIKAACTTLRDIVSSTSLKAQIFNVLFDSNAVRRRCYTPTNEQLAEQLDQWTRVCVFFRGHSNPSLPPTKPPANLGHIDVITPLLNAFQMMLEDDGKNRAQLNAAGAYEFVHAFVCERLDRVNGWPSDNPENTLALWLMWMLTTQERLEAESDAVRERIVHLLLPMVLMPYRYPVAYAPPCYYTLPLSPAPSRSRSSSPSYETPHSIITAHGPYPNYPQNTINAFAYGSRVNLQPPPASAAAKLLYFARRELVPFAIPPHLPPTRADAIQRAHDRGLQLEIGPTQEDIREFNQYRDTRLPVVTRKEGWKGKAPPSKAWDDDFFRTRYCHDPFLEIGRRIGRTYTPGQLNGLWQGRMLIPSEHLHEALITTPGAPALFNEGTAQLTTVPLYMRISEYHYVAASKTRRARKHLAERVRTMGLRSSSTSSSSSTVATKPSSLEVSSPTTSTSADPTLVYAMARGARIAELRAQEEAEANGPGGIVRAPPRRGLLDEGMRSAWLPMGIRPLAVDGGAGLAIYTPPVQDTDPYAFGHRYVPQVGLEDWTPTAADGVPSYYERSQPNHAPTSYDDSSPDSGTFSSEPSNSHDSESCADCLERATEEACRRRLETATSALKFNNLASAPFAPTTTASSKVPRPIPLSSDQVDEAALAAADAIERAELDIVAQAAANEEAVIECALGKDGAENLFRSVGLGYGYGKRRLEEMRQRKAGGGAAARRRGSGGSGRQRPQWGPGREVRKHVDPVYAAQVEAMRARRAAAVRAGGGEDVEMRAADDDDADDAMDEDADLDEDEDDEDDEEEDEDESPSMRRMLDEDVYHDDPRLAPRCQGIRDIIISGRTDDTHGEAWNHFVYRGRIRPWDGFIGILRISRDRRLGDIFMYGTLVAGQNFVGAWRIAHANPEMPAWESAFTMSRREE